MTFVRRWIRLSAQVYPLVLVVLVLTALDSSTAPYPQASTRGSVWHVLTYTWNVYVLTEPLAARPDLGHLWYVCTDLIVIGCLLMLVFVLRRYRLGLAVALVAALIVIAIYKEHVYVTEGLVRALLHIWSRADGLVCGALVAVILPWLQALKAYARPLLIATSVLLVPLMWATNTIGLDDYFGVGGWLLNLDLMVFVAASALLVPRARPVADEPQTGVTLRTRRRLPTLAAGLARLGAWSLVIYVWHFPIFWFVSRNASQTDWKVNFLLAYPITALVAVASQYLIERPVQRWLSSRWWAPFDEGLFPGIVEVIHTWSSGRTLSHEPREPIMEGTQEEPADLVDPGQPSSFDPEDTEDVTPAPSGTSS